ncbi:MAG: DnaJ domain-containing protein [Deltaproteobacteria bacterium]|nr:DnaJ domain-containing protein [Deltaproteobacteria bacterium]
MAPYLLVVESDPELQRQIAETLREAHYELSTEREAAWAKRSLLVRAPDGLVVSTRLSDGTGFKVAADLRRDPEAAAVPIFFLAGHQRGAAHAAEAKRRFAPAEYFEGPLDVNSLLAGVLRSVPPSVETHAETPSFTPPPLDEQQLREREEVEIQAPQMSAAVDSLGEPKPLGELVGTLGRRSFASVLRQLFVEQRTGALLVVREATKKIVYVEKGYPVGVRSNALSECLGQILLARKRITPPALKKSLERMKREKRQQGEILVSMGVLSPHGLDEALQEQTEAKLLDLFSWESGNFVFKDGWKAEGVPTGLHRPTAVLIFDGVRRRYSEERRDYLLAMFAGKYLVPTSDPRLRLQELSAEPADRQLIARADGSATLEEILNLPPVPRERARALVVAMLEAGLVDAQDAPAVTHAPLRAPGAEPSLPQRKSRSELAALAESMRSQTHFEILGVTATDDNDAIEAAYERRARPFHPDSFRGRSEAVRELVENIFARITEARRSLTDPAHRKSYLARLERARSYGGGGADAATAAEQVYYTGVGHLRERRYADAESAFRQATALVPGQPSYHSALGWAVYRRAPTSTEAVATARAELEHAVALSPDDPWVRVSLGRLLAETGSADEAIAVLRSAQSLDPQSQDIQAEIRRLSSDS